MSGLVGPTGLTGSNTTKKKTLVFDRSQYCQRTKELKVLLDVFERIQDPSRDLSPGPDDGSNGTERPSQSSQSSQPTQGSQVVFLKGPSGTGKSALVEEFHDALKSKLSASASRSRNSSSTSLKMQQPQKQTQKQQQLFFVTSKFDEVTQKEPYAVIFDVFNKLCRQILHDAPASELQRIRQNIPDSVKAELKLLLTASIPNLGSILAEDGAEPDASASASAGANDGETEEELAPSSPLVSASALASKVKYLLVKFLQCVCSSSSKRTERAERSNAIDNDVPASSASATVTTTVMVVDDIQWANKAALDLISFLMTDASIYGLLVIGCYRHDGQEDQEDQQDQEDYMLDDVPTQKQIPNSTLGGMFERLDDYKKSYIEIQVKNLTKDETAQYVARVLDAPSSSSASRSEIDALSETLWWKTEGNAFYIRSYLQLLVERDVLIFDIVQYKWTILDQDRLDAELDISDNVLQVVLRKLRSLKDKSLQRILFYASFLPSSFHVNVLRRLLEQCCDNDGDGDSDKPPTLTATDFEHQLETLVMKGLLSNVVGSQLYSFAHDRIQQASMELAELDDDDKDGSDRQSKRKQAMRKVGEVLATDVMSWNDDDDDEQTTRVSASNYNNDWMIFAAIATLESCGYDDDDPENMIRYYLTAAKRSKAVAAYGPAAIYVDKTISLLQKLNDCPPVGVNQDEAASSSDTGGGIWSSRYGQCLDVYLLGTEMNFILGHYKSGDKYCRAIFEHARNERDKLLAYWYLAESLSRQQRPTDALGYLKKILIFLGEYPRHARNPIHMIVQFYKTKRKLKQMSTDDILALPVMTDPDKRLAMRALTSVIMYAGFGGRIVLALQSCLYMFRLTFQHGLSEETATAFVAFAMLCFKAFDDDEFSLNVKSTGVKIFQKVPGSNAFVPLMAAVDFDIWFNPLFEAPKKFDDAFEYAMSSGDSFAGIMSFSCHSYCIFFCGYPLSVNVENSKILVNMIRQYGLDQMLEFFSPFSYLVQHLRGDVDGTQNPQQWISSFVIPNKRTWPRDQIPDIVQGCLSRSIAACLYRFHEQAERHLVGFRHFGDHRNAFFEVVAEIFYAPLIFMSRYKETKKRKYRRMAMKEYKALVKITKDRPINLIHKFYIVDAEFAATFPSKSRKPDEDDGDDVKIKFDKAISTSRRSGYVQDAAFCCELAGEYFIRIADEFWSRHYLSMATRLYGEWGSKGKVRQLRSKYSNYLEVSGKTNVKNGNTKDDDMMCEMKTTRKPIDYATRMEQSYNADQSVVAATSASILSSSNREIKSVDGGDRDSGLQLAQFPSKIQFSE